MNYYQWHIGDYRRDTAHLTLLEHGAYRQLLDSYYLNEIPLPADDATLMRSHCARSADEMQAIRNVLNDFFLLTADGWVHSHCNKVIGEYHEKSETAKASANARWERERAKKNANALPSQSEGNANQEPLTNKPLTKDQNTSVAGKPPTKKLSFDFVDLEIAQLMSDRIALITQSTKKPNLQPWANDIRLMRQSDHRSPEQIRAVFLWANQDDFWKANILSPPSLRKNFDRLFARMNSEPKNETGQPIRFKSKADREYDATLATTNYERAIDF